MIEISLADIPAKVVVKPKTRKAAIDKDLSPVPRVPSVPPLELVEPQLDLETMSNSSWDAVASDRFSDDEDWEKLTEPEPPSMTPPPTPPRRKTYAQAIGGHPK